ncbi:uncharacterized protein LOC130358218 isoform X2 [Hyla sarda]|uniref:uncharacterized protein LOC130358218 isoform X2 n=1 Tax=Hyla sarda TaxID=327740 RepID=UPI0024C3A4B3|nr:uncharacterized protein LOC130358218 isoform X2 [Hyla sarda]
MPAVSTSHCRPTDMEIAFMDHVRRSLMIDSNKDAIIDKLLSLTLEIICLLTGEDYVVVRKSGDPHTAEKRACRGSEVRSEARGLVTMASTPTTVTEENPARRIAGSAKNPHRDAEKLPIKSEDVQISTWDAVAVGGPEPFRSADSAPVHQRILERGVRGHQDSTDPKADYISARITIGSPSRKCRTPVCSQDCSTQEPQAVPPEDGRFHQQCKEEEDAAIPDDIGSGEVGE